MKKVKAVMLIRCNRLFNELEHYLTFHDDGTITESHYINTVSGEKFDFNPERVWDKKFLKSYRIEEL